MTETFYFPSANAVHQRARLANPNAAGNAAIDAPASVRCSRVHMSTSAAPETTPILTRLSELPDNSRDSMDCQEIDAHDPPGSHEPRTQTHRTENAKQTDGDWQTVLTLRQKKALAQAKNQKRYSENAGTSTAHHTSSTPAPGKPKRKSNYRRLPPLPRDDFKIVVRPHQGLPVKNFTSPQLADAVTAACNGQVSGDQFLLRIKPGSNIFIVSTPSQEVADKIRRIAQLNLNDRAYAVNTYVATSEGTNKGVIHGLEPRTPPDTLKANLRIRTQGVEILNARMLGDTKTAVITFYGDITPRYVYYKGGELACYPYKNTTQVCKICHDIGHRSDVCPQPDIVVCHTCGTQNPAPDHECAPICKACREGHLTGDRECKKRLKPTSNRSLKTGKQRQSRIDAAKQKLPAPPRWFSSEDAERNSWPTLTDTQPDSQTRHRLRSRSRSRSSSRSRSRSTRRQNPDPPTFQSSRAPKPETPGHRVEDSQKFDKSKVSWARVVTPAVPITDNPEYQKIIAENKLLRESLQEIKRELASLKQQHSATSQSTAKAGTATTSPAPASKAQTPIENVLAQISQQMQSMQNFQQQLYAEFQNLKSYVDESISSFKQTVRKRTSGSPGAPSSRRPRQLNTTESENNGE